MKKQNKQCKLCLRVKPLCKSHAYPQAFFEKGSWLIDANSSYPKRRPIGPYDTILCEDCEQYLNIKFDNYAKETLIDKKGTLLEVRKDISPNSSKRALYRLQDKEGYARLSRFLISVIWRASVAISDDFKDIYLGPYEEKARQVILNENYNFSNDFSAILFCFPNFNQKINIISKRTRIEGVNFYIFMLGTIKVYLKCDKQAFPLWGQPLILSHHNNILMIEDDLQHHPEYKTLKKSAHSLFYHKAKKRA